jgi:hypothetical protein
MVPACSKPVVVVSGAAVPTDLDTEVTVERLAVKVPDTTPAFVMFPLEDDSSLIGPPDTLVN